MCSCLFALVDVCKSGHKCGIHFLCDCRLQPQVLYNRLYVFLHRDAEPEFHSTNKDTFAKVAVREADSAATKPRLSSPQGKRATPLTVREAGPQKLPKPLQTPSPVPPISPLLKRRKAEAGQTCLPARVSIPTILVEGEPMETARGSDGRNNGSSTQWKERRVLQSKRGPGSPDKGKAPITSVETWWPQIFTETFCSHCFSY